MKIGYLLSILLLTSCAFQKVDYIDPWKILEQSGLEEGIVSLDYNLSDSCVLSFTIVESEPAGAFDARALSFFKKVVLIEVENYFWAEDKKEALRKDILLEVPEYDKAQLGTNKRTRALTVEEYGKVLRIQRAEIQRLKALDEPYRTTIKLSSSRYERVRCIATPAGELHEISVFKKESSSWVAKPEIRLSQFGTMKWKFTARLDE